MAPLLGTIGVIALLATLVIGYAQRSVFDSDQFAARAAATLENEAVRDELAVVITDEVVISASFSFVGCRPASGGVQ